MTTQKPMGQTAPSFHKNSSNRHQSHRHRPTLKKPRYAHKVGKQCNHSTPAPNHTTNAQKGANTPYQYERQRADLSRLPTPTDFYYRHGLTLKGGGVWRSAVCPFHDDTHPSLSINTTHGGYICHVCGASGDMMAFYMNRYHVDFVQACKELDLY